MEPISVGGGGGDAGDDDNLGSRSEFGKFTDADLDKLHLGLNELEKVMSAFPGASASAGGDPTFFIESLTANQSNANNHALPPQTQTHFTTRQILDDFDEFETEMLPPTPSSSLCRQQGEKVTAANHSSSLATRTTTTNEQEILAREIEESQVMIEEMAGDDQYHQGSSTTFVVPGNSNDPTENVDIDIDFDDYYSCHSDIAGGSGIGPCSEEEYNYGCMSGDYFQDAPSMTFFGGSSPTVRYFICSRNSNGPGADMVHRRRKKRRYKGVFETEEETARRVELTKIKNREAAAKAHQRKQAHDADLQTLLLKLRKKNGFLKNMVTFLQGHKRADVHPQPLRRTISGPI